jgi:DNA repair protein RadC
MIEYKSKLDKISLVREKTDFFRAKISSSADAANYAYHFYKGDIDLYESFFMIMLNNANNTVGYVKISQGGINSTLVDVRVLAKYALDSLAVAVILFHNHPSGKLKPSEADKFLTKKVKNTLEIFDCKVLDHIILTPKDDGVLKHFSFADENIL